MFVVALSVFFALTPIAQADDPPPPWVSALVYYDGTPELAEVYAETLQGFADNPSYYPAATTNNPSEFSSAIQAQTHQVLVAVTGNQTEALQWVEEAAAGMASIAVFFPGADPQYPIRTKIVVGRMFRAPPPPPGSPPGPWTWDITNNLLGEWKSPYMIGVSEDIIPVGFLSECMAGAVVNSSGAAASVDPPWYLNLFGINNDTWDNFLRWLQDMQRRARESAAAILAELSKLLEEMGDAKVQVRLRLKASATVPPVVEWEVELIGEMSARDVSKLTGRLGKIVQPPPPAP